MSGFLAQVLPKNNMMEIFHIDWHLCTVMYLNNGHIIIERYNWQTHDVVLINIKLAVWLVVVVQRWYGVHRQAL